LRARANSVGFRVGAAQTRRRPRSGWASLTPTEATIVELVRQGLSNPAIARRLYLSPRTVQTHVSHILQKTDLRSRVEIAAAAPRG
jgi:DNA-binding CsgD family transcriptional regulator